MNLRKITSRVAVAGATTALAAGALVGITGTAANAAEGTNTYTCSLGALYSGDFVLTASVEVPVPRYYAGAAVPAGIIPVSVSAVVPADGAALMGTVGITGARSDDFGFSLGTGSVPAPISGAFAAEGGTTTWEATGANGDFTTGNPGLVDGFLPDAFTITPTMADGSDFSNDLSCVLKDAEAAEVVSDFALDQQSSATTAPKTLTAKKNKAVSLSVSVSSTSMGGPVPGKVTVKEGKKTLGSATLKNGKAKVNLGKLKKGKHKVTVTYAGTTAVKGSSAKTTITVK